MMGKISLKEGENKTYLVQQLHWKQTHKNKKRDGGDQHQQQQQR